MNRTKRKTEAHVIDTRAQAAFKKILPVHWTVREYKPDYGIDFAIELFEPNTSGSYDTLGEHLFVQLKGTRSIQTRKLKLTPRLNVEKYPIPSPRPRRPDSIEIEVIPFQIETPELITVQRMGSSLLVILVVVDIATERSFFLCLNDYIDKVLLPEDPAYSEQDTKTIYVPTRNVIGTSEDQLIPLRFYAKRAKLYAAFQKFAYQRKELAYTPNQELGERAKYFAEIFLRYDFWNSCAWWVPISLARRHLDSLVQTGSPGLMRWFTDEIPEEIRNRLWTDEFSSGARYSLEEFQRFQEIRTLWDQLANLGSIHEEVCREWLLPTFLGVLSS